MDQLKLAGLVAAGMLAFSGAAQAVKGAGDCTAAEFKVELDASAAIYKSVVKYCPKAPDAELAAKSGEKMAKKFNKAIEKYNDRIEQLDCAANADPNNPVMPTAESLTAAEGAAILTAVDEECNGENDI